MLRIDPRDALPIWKQIEDGLRRMVGTGGLRPGRPVPSVRDLARELRVNPMTVSKAYQRLAEAGVLVVRRGGVSFDVPRGTVFALLGRNGTGKSSLVRCALGQQKPTRGATRLFGEDAWASRPRAMARIGVVPEEPDAPPDMTAAELLAFCAPLYETWDDAAARARLERSAVPLRAPFGTLSKGQKGAVMLALALAAAPELLILDDPTLRLDSVARRA